MITLLIQVWSRSLVVCAELERPVHTCDTVTGKRDLHYMVCSWNLDMIGNTSWIAIWIAGPVHMCETVTGERLLSTHVRYDKVKTNAQYAPARQ